MSESPSRSSARKAKPPQRFGFSGEEASDKPNGAASSSSASSSASSSSRTIETSSSSSSSSTAATTAAAAAAATAAQESSAIKRSADELRRRLSSRDVETSKPVALRKNSSTPATPGWLPPLAVAPTDPAVHVQHYNAWDTAVFVFLLSLLALPACWAMSHFQADLAPYTLHCALAAFLLVIAVYHLVVFKQLPHDQPHAFFLAWFSVAAFASVVTALLAWTIDGGSSIMSWYVDALPHWSSGWGFALALWHGSVLYALHLQIVYALGHRADRLKFRSYELFWCGASVTSLATVLASTLQYFSMEWVLCVFVLIITVNYLFALLLHDDTGGDAGPAKEAQPTSAAAPSVLTSLVLALALGAGLAVLALRGAVAMNVEHPVVEDWATRHEPILREKSGFFRCQAMAGLFLVLPAGVLGLLGLATQSAQRRRRTFIDLASLAFGGLAVAQFVSFVAAWHWRTPDKFQPASFTTSAALTVATLLTSLAYLRTHAQ